MSKPTHSVALSPDEIKEITGFRYPSRQIRALVLMEIPFKVRPDGTPLVFRSVTQPDTTTPKAKPAQWDVRM
jgi:hypothetical protein